MTPGQYLVRNMTPSTEYSTNMTPYIQRTDTVKPQDPETSAGIYYNPRDKTWRYMEKFTEDKANTQIAQCFIESIEGELTVGPGCALIIVQYFYLYVSLGRVNNCPASSISRASVPASTQT